MTPRHSEADRPWRDRLRRLPVFADDLPPFDTGMLPADPLELVGDWLDDAIASGMPQPHAVTLATADGTGAPSTRTLILKDLDADGMWFATPSTSVAGRQLADNPAAALQIYWPRLGRQIRAEGLALAGPAGVSRADWEARSEVARTRSDVDTWTAYLLRPRLIEFLAASPDREHLRVAYSVGESGWSWTRVAA